MRGLSVAQLSKSFGGVSALDNVSLHVPLGSLVCFLGPSGCGKTTLLRIIAGLESASSGSVLFDDYDITDRPAHKRSFGMVFQSLALFPHLNVEGNVTYSMKIAGRGARARRERAQELLELVQLPDLGSRRIHQLSGGQRQRVAIARALAQEPQLLLLDEPMSALDAQLREGLQVELRLLQRRLKITSILVTHDQKEAMTMADIVVVMNRGRIEQMGTPLDIYRKPASLFVAGFIGQSNLLPARVAAGTVVLGSQSVPLPGVVPPDAANDAVTVGIRPEQVRLFPHDQPAPNRIAAEVKFVRDLGASVEVHLSAGELRLVSTLSPRDWHDFREGDAVQAELPAADCAVFAAA